MNNKYSTDSHCRVGWCTGNIAIDLYLGCNRFEILRVTTNLNKNCRGFLQSLREDARILYLNKDYLDHRGLVYKIQLRNS
jgi:hypothetical protein